jgi:nitroreductase
MFFIKALRLPKSTKVDVMISLGYPDENLPAKKRIRKSLDEMRRYH